MIENKSNENEIWNLICQYQKNECEKESFLSRIKDKINDLLIIQKTLLKETENLTKSLVNKEIEISALQVNLHTIENFIYFIYTELVKTKQIDNKEYPSKIINLENKILNFINSMNSAFQKSHNHFLIQQNSILKSKLKDFNLTEVEFRICSLIFLNFQTKEIANIQNLSVRSVESHKYRIKKKYV